MKVYDAPNIRNVALVGHGGSGKTSLASALLFDTGAVNRMGRVEDGTTVTDFDPDEIERKISLQSALAFCEWKKTKINLIDTPGYANFLSEARAGLRVVDAAVVVVDAVAGVEVQTEKVWSYADEFGLAAPDRRQPHGPGERVVRPCHRVDREGLRTQRGAGGAADRRGARLQGHRRPRLREGAALRRGRERQVAAGRRTSRRAGRGEGRGARSWSRWWPRATKT